MMRYVALQQLPIKQVVYPVSTVVNVYKEDGTLGTKTLKCDLILTFDDKDKCTITSGTEGYTATGTGTWTKEGAKKAWGACIVTGKQIGRAHV